MKRLKNIGNITVNILFGLCMVVVIWAIVQIFFFASFKVPSNSMEPTLEIGDYILVWKGVPGARLFNLFDSLNEKQVEIYRLPGVRKIRRNDMVVFHFPHPYSWDKIEMHIMKYYVKRAIGLPGDTISIQQGMFTVNGYSGIIGNLTSQEEISRRVPDSFSDEVYHTYPFDSLLGWNIQKFGPLYIPRKGDRLRIDPIHFSLYKKLIAWEQNAEVIYSDSVLYINGQAMNDYTFRKNYYFVAGDKGENSQDSRYWGLLPEEYIVGKAFMVWKSVDPYTGKWKWDRFMKRIGSIKKM